MKYSVNSMGDLIPYSPDDENVTVEFTPEYPIEFYRCKDGKIELLAWKNQRYIQEQLNALSMDIIQDCAGEIVPDIEDRKLQFINLHNELRKLLGLQHRQKKDKA